MNNLFQLMCIEGCGKDPEKWAIVVATIFKILVYFIPFMVIAWTIAYYVSWITKDKKKRTNRKELIKKYLKKLLLITIIWIGILIFYLIFYFINVENPVAQCWC